MEGGQVSVSVRPSGTFGRASLWCLSQSSSPHKCTSHLGFSLVMIIARSYQPFSSRSFVAANVRLDPAKCIVTTTVHQSSSGVFDTSEESRYSWAIVNAFCSNCGHSFHQVGKPKLLGRFSRPGIIIAKAGLSVRRFGWANGKTGECGTA